MDPNVWGPVTWRVLHGLVEEYVPALHASYRGLFYSLAAALPCKKCRNNYVIKIVESPFPCQESIVRVRNWVIDNHNAVNRDLQKPVLSRKRARELIRPVRQADVKRMLGFIRKNMEQNNPPASYRAGVEILERHLRDILSVIGPLNRPARRAPRRPARPPGQPRAGR